MSLHDDDSVCDDLVLDRYRTNEMSDDEAAALRLHLEQSLACAQRLAHLNAARADFLLLPPLVFPTTTAASTASTPAAADTPATRRAWRAWAARATAVSSIAAAALVVLVVRGGDVDGDADGHTRSKGEGVAAVLSFYVARGSDVFVADGTRPLRAHDAVRARVRSQGDGFVAVVEREADGDVVPLLATRPMHAVHAGDSDVPGTAVLDAQAGPVSFIALLCAKDTTIDDDVLAAIGRDAPPDGCTLQAHAFVKEAP